MDHDWLLPARPADCESITAGVLRCESAESGVTCRDLETAHGFSISRRAYQLF
jgi:hypothetical protein